MDSHETHAEPNMTPIHADCPQGPLIWRHASEIDAAHTKVRDLAAEMAMLKALVQQGTERVNRLEEQVSRVTTTVETIRGELEAIRALQTSALAQIQTLEEVVRNTNTMLLDRLNAAKTEATTEHVERLQEVEKITVRLVKITGLLSVIVFVLAAIWKMVFGPGVAAVLRGVFQ